MDENNSAWVQTFTVAPPTLENNTADADRLVEALKVRLDASAVELDLSLLKHLPGLLRKCDYRVRCVVFKERNRLVLIHAGEPEDDARCGGLAVDLGTTRVALRLIDLISGETMGETGFLNPQAENGPDILTRIHFAEQQGGLGELNRLIIEGLNRNIAELCGRVALKPENIHVLSVAGNTAMTHLLLGLEPRWLVREPYIPAVNRPGTICARELGLRVNPRARVFIFPNSGSYFGGDLIAGILYSGLSRQEETAILVDVGTNAEVVLGNSNWLIGCAGAAGPALEGGAARMGMVAGPGVIDRVTIDPETREFGIHTIEDKPPRGICGSGLIDLAANLFLSGMIDVRGKLVPALCGDRIKGKGGALELVIVPAGASANGDDLTVGQIDLDSLIRSKAAMHTILETITMTVGMSPVDIKTFYVAGAFGSFIDPESAISIGMLPDLPRCSYRSLGNSSLGGAAMVLSSPAHLQEIDAIRDRITYLELNVNQGFMNRYSAAKFLPHTDPLLFPSVKPRVAKSAS